MTSGTRHSAAIDILKALAIAGVIAQHGLPAIDRHTAIEGLHWGQAVPVFVILTGLNLAHSARRRGLTSLRDLYSRAYLSARLRRLLPPLVVLYVAVIVAGALEGDLYVGALTPLGALPFHGPGNYYLPLIFELVAVFPLVYWAYRRRPVPTLVACLVLDAAFEIAFTHVHRQTGSLSPGGITYVYDLCFLRYLWALALGVWLADGARLASPRNAWLLVLAAVGAVYIVLENRHELTFALFDPGFERRTNFVAAPYAAFLVMAGLALLPATARRPPTRALAEVGRASYHVFLVQLLWFGLFGDLSIGRTLVALAVCAPAGVLFFLVVPGWPLPALRARRTSLQTPSR